MPVNILQVGSKPKWEGIPQIEEIKPEITKRKTNVRPWFLVKFETAAKNKATKAKVESKPPLNLE